MPEFSAMMRIRPLKRRIGRFVSNLLYRTALSFRLLDAERRALPDFIVAGAQRCGTTFLFSCLMSHPACRPPLRREVHFFDSNFSKGLGWYKAHFPVRPHSPGLPTNASFTGESSPCYLFHPHAPRRIAEQLPSVKLIVCLRNPVDRAWSHYWHSINRGVESLSFEEAIEAESTRLVAPDVNHDDPASSCWCFSYLSRGLYAEQLSRLFRHVPRQRVLVIISEKMFSSPAAVLPEVCAFLGIEPSRVCIGEAINTTHPPRTMNPETRRKLAEYYSPHNRRLSELLGMDLEWDEQV